MLTRLVRSSCTRIVQMSSLSADIEDLHRSACLNRQALYEDPASGYSVFTAYSHLKRGHCCGSACRHCPFGHFACKRIPETIVEPNRVQQPVVLRTKRNGGDMEPARTVLMWQNDFISFAALFALQQSHNPALKGKVMLLLPVDASQRLAGTQLSIQSVFAHIRALKVQALAFPLSEPGNSVASAWQNFRDQNAIQSDSILINCHGSRISQDLSSVASTSDSSNLFTDEQLLDAFFAQEKFSVSISHASVSARAKCALLADEHLDASRALFDAVKSHGVDPFGRNGEFQSEIRI